MVFSNNNCCFKESRCATTRFDDIETQAIPAQTEKIKNFEMKFLAKWNADIDVRMAKTNNRLTIVNSIYCYNKGRWNN